MKNLSSMLKEAQKLQSRMAEMQQRLAETEMEGQSGGGIVTVTLNGKGEMRRIKIDKSLADPEEMEILEDSGGGRDQRRERPRSRPICRTRWAS